MKEYDSIKREVLENILLKFGIPVKLIRLYLNEIYNKVRIDNGLFDKILLFRMI
jgi:hypothetical protein